MPFRTQPLTTATVVARSDGMATTTVDGEILTLVIEVGKFFAMKESGARIWELIEQPRTVDSVVAQLIEEYDVDRSTCERETMTFLEKLRDGQLIRTVG